MPLLDTELTKPTEIQRLCFVRDVIRRIHAKTSRYRHGGISCFLLFRLAMLAIQKHRRLLGEAGRAKRKQAAFSQEKLAEKADLSTVFISRVERGVESPTVDNLVKIARALGVPVQDLICQF